MTTKKFNDYFSVKPVVHSYWGTVYELRKLSTNEIVGTYAAEAEAEHYARINSAWIEEAISESIEKYLLGVA